MPRWEVGSGCAWRASTVTVAVVLLVFLGSCSDEMSYGPPASGEIGPAGGELSLEDGTTLIVPPGAVAGPVVFQLIPVASEPEAFGESEVAAGPAFRIEPVMMSASPFIIRVPVSHVAPATDAPPVWLMVSGPGLRDGADEEGSPVASAERVHLVRNPRATGDGAFAEFTLRYTGPDTFQAMTDESRLVGEPGAARASVREALVGEMPPVFPESCRDALTRAEAVYEPDGNIDDRVEITYPPGARHNIQRHCDGLEPVAAVTFIAAMHRFVARVCMATDRSLLYYAGPLGLPVPTDEAGALSPIRVLIRWRPAPGFAGTLGAANRNGFRIFFDPFRSGAAYSGAGPAGMGLSAWNEPGAAADRLEQTCAHELFHVLDDAATGRVGPVSLGIDAGGIDIWTEGAADAAAERVFDDVSDHSHQIFPLWRTSLWKRIRMLGEDHAVYAGHAFWRMLDAQQDDEETGASVISRVLQRVAARAASGSPTSVTGEDVDAALAEMFRSREAFDRNAAHADFAAAHLFLHDYERSIEGSPADLTPDALGVASHEEVGGMLWGRWAVVWPWPPPDEDAAVVVVRSYPAVDTPTSPTGHRLAPTDLPTEREFAIPAGAADLVAISLAAAGGTMSQVPATRVVVSATRDGTAVAEVGLRLYRRRSSPERAQRMWRIDELSTEVETPSQTTIPSAVAMSDELVLTIANFDRESEVRVTVRLEESDDELIALTSRGVTRLTASGESVSPVAIGGSRPGFVPVGVNPKGLAVYRGGSRALVSDWADQSVRMVRLDAGAEAVIDLDAAMPGTQGYTFEPDARPFRIAVTPDARFAFVTLYYRQEVAVLRLDGDMVAACERFSVSQERPYDVVIPASGDLVYVSLQGRASAPGSRIAVVSRTNATDCAPPSAERGEAVLGDMELGVRARPGDLELSHDGRYLAVAGRANNRILLVRTGSTVAGHSVEDFMLTVGRGHRFVETANLPTQMAFSSDDTRLYFGNTTGVEGTDLSGFGTVRYAHLPVAPDPLRGHDTYDVGVFGSVMGLVLGGDGVSVYVFGDIGSDMPSGMTHGGAITHLNEARWEGPVVMGSHVGGCVRPDRDPLRAAPCTPALSLGEETIGIAFAPTNPR